MGTIDSASEILNSWKEVADYLGRGTRTVQRWERELGLPVRRPRGKKRSPIIALRPDLDAWLRDCPQINHQEQGKPLGTGNEKPLRNGNGKSLPVALISPAAKARLEETILASRGLRTQARELREELSAAVRSLVTSLQQMQLQQIPPGADASQSVPAAWKWLKSTALEEGSEAENGPHWSDLGNTVHEGAQL